MRLSLHLLWTISCHQVSLVVKHFRGRLTSTQSVSPLLKRVKYHRCLTWRGLYIFTSFQRVKTDSWISLGFLFAIPPLQKCLYIFGRCMRCQDVLIFFVNILQCNLFILSCNFVPRCLLRMNCPKIIFHVFQ